MHACALVHACMLWCARACRDACMHAVCADVWACADVYACAQQGACVASNARARSAQPGKQWHRAAALLHGQTPYEHV